MIITSKEVFGLFDKCAESVTNVVLWIYLLISTYFIRIFGIQFLAFNVIKQGQPWRIILRSKILLVFMFSDINFIYFLQYYININRDPLNV